MQLANQQPYPTIEVLIAAVTFCQKQFRQKNAMRFVHGIKKRREFRKNLMQYDSLGHTIQGCRNLFSLSDARNQLFDTPTLCEIIRSFLGTTPHTLLSIGSVIPSLFKILNHQRIHKVIAGFTNINVLTIISTPFACNDSHSLRDLPLAPPPHPKPSLRTILNRERKKVRENHRHRANKMAQVKQFVPKMLTEKVALLLGVSIDTCTSRSGHRKLNKREIRLFAKLLIHFVRRIQIMIRIKQKMRFNQLVVPAIVRIQKRVRIRQAKRCMWIKKLQHQFHSGC